MPEIHVPKDIPRWMYEAFQQLSKKADTSVLQIAAIGRGEAPDGSGTALIDTSKFFFLPGRTGGQIGYGGTGANDNLTFSSTTDPDKGFIYLGYPNHRVALDEDQGFLGIGTDSPSARLHIATTALGTAVIGDLGTAFAKFTYAATNKLTIAPILNNSGVVDIALSVDNGSVQFIDSSLGAAGLRIAFSSTAAFVQAGRVNSLGTIQNRNMQFGGVNATVGAALLSNFQRVGITTTAGTEEGGSAISANDAFVAINLTVGDYASSTAANRPSLLIAPRATATTVGALVIESASATNNVFEIRKASTGVAPAKVLGDRTIAIGPGLGSLTADRSIIGYLGNVETMRLSPLSSSSLQWAFQSPAGLNQVGHTLVPTSWADAISGDTARIDLGDISSSHRAVALVSSGGNIMTRFGISATGVTIENTTLGGGAVGLSAPLGIVYIVNNATNGTNGAIPLIIRTKRSGQTGDLFQIINATPTTLFSVAASGSVNIEATTGTKLTLAAGTTTSGPLRLTSGASLTTALAGMFEFTTDDLFFTITTGTARKRILLADPTGGLTSGRIPFATTNGRLTDDAAFLFTAGTGLTLSALNIVTDTTTGMKIATATAQKLGFWNATPIVQPTTAVAAATFVANTSGIVDDSATFDGYTIGQITKALRNAGLLA